MEYVWQNPGFVWPFLLHLILLVYFSGLWLRSARHVRAFEDWIREASGRPLSAYRRLTKKGSVEKPRLFAQAEERIKQYANQGRECDLQQIEKFISDPLTRDQELMRPIMNAFVVVGLMGTLLMLYRSLPELKEHIPQIIGAQNGKSFDDILSNLKVAFMASFVGLVCALGCSLFFFSPLRKRTTSVLQEVHGQLVNWSQLNTPKKPENVVEQIAGDLRSTIEEIRNLLKESSNREEQNLAASTRILDEFGRTSSKIIGELAATIRDGQAKTEAITQDLKTGIENSLSSLNRNFIDLSNQWKEERDATIETTGRAVGQLAEASGGLKGATERVSTALNEVCDALKRMENLNVIALNVRKLTDEYLNKTEVQIAVFRGGLSAAEEAIKAAVNNYANSLKESGDMLFTQLNRRNDEMRESFKKETDGWREHVSETSNLLSTRFGKVDESLGSLNEFLKSDGTLSQTFERLGVILREIAPQMERLSKADQNVQLEGLTASIKSLCDLIEKQLSKEPASEAPATSHFDDLIASTNRLSDRINDLRSELPSVTRRVSAVEGTVESIITKTDDLRTNLESTDGALDNVVGELNGITKRLKEIKETGLWQKAIQLVRRRKS